MNNQLVSVACAGVRTTDLLGVCLTIMNRGGRVKLLTPRGDGAKVLQRLRVRLSRLRNSMDEKGLPKQHFKLSASVFPYTKINGELYDCVILAKIRHDAHMIAESFERVFKNG